MRLFRVRAFPLIATLVLCTVFLKLGWWQWQKAMALEEHIARQEALDRETPVWVGASLLNMADTQGRMAQVQGRFDYAGEFFLDNQQHQGRPGVHVITPLVIDGSQVLLWVDRGWVAWGQGRDVLPQVKQPAGLVQLKGRLVLSNDKPPAFVSEMADPNNKLRVRVHLDELRKASPHPVQPLLLQVFDTSQADDLVREWPALENKVPMHQGYALQWLLMTLVALGFFIRSSYRPQPT